MTVLLDDKADALSLIETITLLAKQGEFEHLHSEKYRNMTACLREGVLNELTKNIETAKLSEGCDITVPSYFMRCAVMNNHLPLHDAALSRLKKATASAEITALGSSLVFAAKYECWKIATPLFHQLFLHINDADIDTTFKGQRTAVLACLYRDPAAMRSAALVEFQACRHHPFKSQVIELATEKLKETSNTEKMVTLIKAISANAEDVPELTQSILTLLFGKPSDAIFSLPEQHAAFYPQIITRYLKGAKKDIYSLLSRTDLADWQRGKILGMVTA